MMLRLILRAIPLALVLVAAAPGASAQTNRFDRDFGLSADEWCRDGDSGGWNRLRSSCDVREESLGGVTAIDADPGGNGGIRVLGSNRSDVRLRARIMAFARTEEDARDLLSQVRLDLGGGRVRAEGPERREREYWSVSFELEVPRTIQMELNTRNGGIAVQDYAGTAVLRTRNGGISLGDVGGNIRGETRNGGISVNLEGNRWEGAGLDLETRNGGVVMSIPSSYSAELEAGTRNGGIDIDFPVVVQGTLTRLNRQITTTLGSGGPRLRVMTTNGGVRIRRR